MGLFDLFRRTAPQPQPRPAPPAAGRRFPRGDPPRFELDRTRALEDLFAVPRAERDEDWTARFWEAAWTAALMAPDPPEMTGPDRFPYLRLDLPGEWTSFPQRSLMHVAESLVEQGYGAAFFSSAGAAVADAEYVVPMGVIDSILRFDDPAGEPAELEETRNPSADGVSRVELRAGEQLLFGTPSEQYLSRPAARALYRHLVEGWRLEDPRVALVVSPSLRPSRALVIGKTAAQFAAEGYDASAIAQGVQALLWYLPPSRSLMLMSDEWELRSMTPLRDLF